MPVALQSLSERRWFAPTVLAIPFLVMIAVLRGMTATLPIFHGSDELVYHYPTILRFSRELPFPDLHSYHAAQTPLYHLLMAYIGKVIGYQLWRLRMVQVLISYGLALAVFGLLARRLRMDRLQALAMTLLFVISPYVFGQSFRLGTDNLALLFSILAIDRFERFRECDRLGPFLAGCALIAAATLTRQSAAFLVPVAGLYALRPGANLSASQRAAALGAVALSVVPVGLLFLNWHGLVPVGGDPGSCGLCAKKGGSGLSLSGLEVHTMELTLASIGIYGTVLFAPEWIPSVRALLSGEDRAARIKRVVRAPLIAALAGAVLLALFPARPGNEAAGDVWKVAGHLPSIHGSSLLFWVLVPLACAVLWLRLERAERPWLVAVTAGCFLIAAVAIRYPWQKYVDPFALLILLFTLAPDELLRARRRLTGAAVLLVAFLAYTVDYSSHRSTPHPAVAAASLTRASGSAPSLNPPARRGAARARTADRRTA
jgi:4-amino-4-deoxy-L-arabinose transferase-like glycosyltransferase